MAVVVEAVVVVNVALQVDVVCGSTSTPDEGKSTSLSASTIGGGGGGGSSSSDGGSR